VANVFSLVLASYSPASVGDNLVGSPPAGFVWIVNDISVLWPGGATEPLSGFTVTDGLNAPLFGVRAPYALQGAPYHWSGRQVIETIDSLHFWSYDVGWTARISGYQLTLP
jgi:hypothetical protein